MPHGVIRNDRNLKVRHKRILLAFSEMVDVEPAHTFVIECTAGGLELGADIATGEVYNKEENEKEVLHTTALENIPSSIVISAVYPLS